METGGTSRTRSLAAVDDQPANHAAFWDGHFPVPTPAFDLTRRPLPIATPEQAMAIGRAGGSGSRSSVRIAATADRYLSRREALDSAPDRGQGLRAWTRLRRSG